MTARYNPKKVRAKEKRLKEKQRIYREFIEPHIMTYQKLIDAVKQFDTPRTGKANDYIRQTDQTCNGIQTTA